MWRIGCLEQRLWEVLNDFREELILWKWWEDGTLPVNLWCKSDFKYIVDSGLFQLGIAVVMKCNLVVLRDTKYQLCALSAMLDQLECVPCWSSPRWSMNYSRSAQHSVWYVSLLVCEPRVLWTLEVEVVCMRQGWKMPSRQELSELYTQFCWKHKTAPRNKVCNKNSQSSCHWNLKGVVWFCPSLPSPGSYCTKSHLTEDLGAQLHPYLPGASAFWGWGVVGGGGECGWMSPLCGLIDFGK